MSLTTNLLSSIQSSEHGLTLAKLLAARPDVARRTAQRLIAKLIDSGIELLINNIRQRRIEPLHDHEFTRRFGGKFTAQSSR